MSGTNMYGVVLWSDEVDRKAVVWCEDHGNLAFYSASDGSAFEGVSLDAGDLIQFDLREDENIRRVRNPQLVLQDQCPQLAQDLVRSAAPTVAPATPQRRNIPRQGGTSNVVALNAYRPREDVMATA